MYYVAGASGFLDIRNTSAGKSKTVYETDVRKAKVFQTYGEADLAARSRVLGHYVVLSVNHAPMTVAH